jgi:hypothetical protein
LRQAGPFTGFFKLEREEFIHGERTPGRCDGEDNMGLGTCQ